MGLVGFFDKELLKPVPKKRVVSETRKKPITNPCEACGLYKQCNSPKMKYTGKGKEKILIIAEAPGSSEDEKGVQLIGEAGQILRDSLKIFGMDLDRDFWKTNSVICRPPKNRKPTRRELKLCRFNIENAIKELKPKFIWLMGGSAVESFYMERFSDTLAINIWRKRLIPDYDHNCFIIPMFHPSYILRNQDVKLEMIFKSDLKWALSCLDKELPAPVNIDKVKVLTNVNKILTQLKHVLDTKEKINFDYETSRLNPHIKGGKIWTIAYNGISFGLDHPEAKHSIIALEAIETLWKKILTDPEIQKTAQNLKFEDGWSRARFGVVPKGWIHDTMVTQHILEHRPTSTALKFQSYVRWGVPYYEKETEKYIIKGSREPNTLDKMPMHDLCVYNAIDTLMSDRLEKEQKRELKKYPDLTRANDLFFEGTLTFCDIESYGICIDEKWYNTRNKKLTLMCDELEDKMKNSREARKFKRKTGKELLITSNKDLSLLFFDVLELTPMKTTDKGTPSVDVEALSAFNLPFIDDLLKYRKLIKIRDTYLAQFIRENVNGKIYPSFKIHTVDTYRSSSSNPNFQNIPVRDEEARKETRSGIIPTKGNKLLEVDYSAMEVRICACYTKDPALIQYINNPKSDMHKDQAKKLFKLNENEVTKDIRFHAKNGFVFPEIYGSYFVTCANNLWKEAKLLKTKTGQPLLEHLKDRRIHSINDFTDHVKSVEDEFWNTFPLIKEWTEDNTEFYLRRGYIPFLFGHRRSGFLSRNAISNYPIQGAAFHCLFWSLIQLGKIALKEKWKTKRIGQIHDSIVFDLHPSEEDHVVEVVKRVMTQDIRKQFDFLIVPLEVEFDITEIDGSWYTKKSLKIGK